MIEGLANVRNQHLPVPNIKPKVVCVWAFHSIAITKDIKGYNWCKLVVDRLIKGVAKFKARKRKFVSGCLFFLTVWTLDL